MLRVLHIIVGSGSYGGAEQFALSYYGKMNRDNIAFDFLFLHKNVLKNIKDNILEASKIYELGTWKTKANKLKNYIQTIKGVKSVIKQGNYDVIHVNSGIIKVQIVCLFAAKLAGARVRIAHSHTAKAADKINQETMSEKIKTALVRSLATDYFGCSRGAGLYLFGRKGVESNRFKVIPNALDLDKYRYSGAKETDIRVKLNEHGSLVFAHIGRFIEVKNQRFVIDVFSEIKNKLPQAVLWMVGDGVLLESLKSYVKSCGLDESVRFFGERNDVPELLQAMDALIFPSLHEGLSIVVTEAQASGLNVFAADTLSEEHTLSKNIHYLSLADNASDWAQYIIEHMKGYVKSPDQEMLKDAGYELNKAAKVLEQFYLNK